MEAVANVHALLRQDVQEHRPLRAVGAELLVVLVDRDRLRGRVEPGRMRGHALGRLALHHEHAGVAQRVRASQRPDVLHVEQALGLLGKLEDDIARRNAHGF